LEHIIAVHWTMDCHDAWGLVEHHAAQFSPAAVGSVEMLSHVGFPTLAMPEKQLQVHFSALPE